MGNGAFVLPLSVIKPISKETWKGFTDKGKWDVMAAMRGPDHPNEMLKYLTTAVLRWKTHLAFRTGGMINEWSPIVIAPSNAIKWGTFNYSHFIGHVNDACGWLGVPRITIPFDVFEKLSSYECAYIQLAQMSAETLHLNDREMTWLKAIADQSFSDKVLTASNALSLAKGDML